MSWRVVVVSSNAKVDYKMDYIVVRGIDKLNKVHISEIAVLILESTATSITSYALCKLLDYKIKVIFCDEKRNPHGELISIYGSHDTSSKVRSQIKWTNDIKENIWTEIIREKITNQMRILKKFDLSQHEILSKYLEELEINDSTNREGHSAKVYFNALFGNEFSRSQENNINKALNYGYAIILSNINREINASGYLTQLGIFHDNMYNPFNLASDFIEPLRGLIDNKILEMNLEEFGSNEKREIVSLLNKEVIINGKRQYLTHAIRLYCRSLLLALENKNTEEMRFIEYEL